MGVSFVVPVILAAGAGRRMGGCKALCDFDGRKALELVMTACADLPAPVVVLGAEADRVRAQVPLAHANVVVNPAPERGQTSSLQVGLQVLAAGADAFLLFPVDYPLVPAAEVTRLVEAFGQERARGATPPVVALSYQRRRGHPVLVTRPLVAPLLALADDASARDVLNSEAVLAGSFYVTTDDATVVWDMDTEADHQRLLQHYRQRKGQGRS